jgi:hypothetical protein
MNYSRREIAALPILLAGFCRRGSAQAKPAPKEGDDFQHPIKLDLDGKRKASKNGVGDTNLRHNIVYKIALDEGNLLTATLSDPPKLVSAPGAMVIRLVKGDAKDFQSATVLETQLTIAKNPKTSTSAKIEYAVPAKDDYFIAVEFLAGGTPFQLDIEVTTIFPKA